VVVFLFEDSSQPCCTGQRPLVLHLIPDGCLTYGIMFSAVPPHPLHSLKRMWISGISVQALLHRITP